MTTPKQPQLSKKAVDEVAERYWQEYYSDSGYGKAWVKTIPMRVKAELSKRASATGKTASAPDAIVVQPLSTIIAKDRVHLEGRAFIGSGEKRQAKLFVVDFDHEGNVHGFDSVDIK